MPKTFKEGDLITIRARTGRTSKVAVVFHQQGRDIFYRTVRSDRSLGRLDTIVCTSDLISDGPRGEVLKLVKKGTKVE